MKELERVATSPRFAAIDVIDVHGPQEMGGIRGHGYWYANEWIANDVLVLLRFPFPPQQRCLVPAGKANAVEVPRRLSRLHYQADARHLP